MQIYKLSVKQRLFEIELIGGLEASRMTEIVLPQKTAYSCQVVKDVVSRLKLTLFNHELDYSSITLLVVNDLGLAINYHFIVRAIDDEYVLVRQTEHAHTNVVMKEKREYFKHDIEIDDSIYKELSSLLNL